MGAPATATPTAGRPPKPTWAASFPSRWTAPATRSTSPTSTTTGCAKWTCRPACSHVYAGEGPDGFGFSGDGGPATAAEFVFPDGVAVDASGRLSIADFFNDRIRQVDPDTGIITTIAGNGDPTSRRATADPPPPPRSRECRSSSAPTARATYSSPTKSASTRIRRIDAITGIITTVVGGGASPLGTGSATDVNLGNVHAYTAVDDAGRLFFAHGQPGVQGGPRNRPAQPLRRRRGQRASAATAAPHSTPGSTASAAWRWRPAAGS